MAITTTTTINAKSKTKALSSSIASLKGATTKWFIFEIAFLGFCCFINETTAHVLVYRVPTNQLIEEFNDLPAQFGPSLPQYGLKVYPVDASPIRACESITRPPRSLYPPKAKFVAVIERGGDKCSFELKVRNAQEATFDAVIVYNNNGDDLEQMSAANKTDINIPSVFVGETTGYTLKSFQRSDIILVINDELPFNINTQLILPFSILIGICFLIMIFYMIFKCIREERRLRRYRLPKRMLKKLPILKYTKNNELAYDTCVICLDEFVEGDRLRVLPCRHPYHSKCIDPWLTENRRVCPICKRKVFTKGTARSNRNRQTSLDSVTDTDDDTTPLLQPAANNRSNVSGRQRETTTTTSNTSGTAAGRNSATAAGVRRTATTHGTFRRNNNNQTNITTNEPTSDEENALLVRDSPRRINPFDRTPNLPPHVADQLAGNSNGSRWSLFRFFRQTPAISVAAPPFLEEVVTGPQATTTTATPPVTVISNSTSNSASTAANSNNILNPNLSGSFKDDDESPHQSIYEPIAMVTPTEPTTSTTTNNGNNTNNPKTLGTKIATGNHDDGEFDADSIFIQTPSHGGIGVVALPNANDQSHYNLI